MSTPNPKSNTTCSEETKKINELNNIISTQQETIKNNLDAISHVGGTTADLIENAQKTPIPFSLLALSLVLLVLVPFITFLYNSLLTRQIMIFLEKNGILDAMVKSFQTGSFMVNIDGENKTFRYFWDDALVTINTYITRGRFFMVVALFMTLLCFILLTYSLYYRGLNYQNSAKMISIALSTVLGFTFIFMNNQTMTRPFENTVGYVCVKYLMGAQIKDSITGIFSHKYFMNKKIFPGSNLYYDFILNTITLSSLPTIFEEIFKNGEKYDFEINLDPENGITKTRMDNLVKIILTKNTIGNTCWMYFASLVGSMISFQYLLSNEM